MLKEQALVIHYANGIATIKCHSKTVCGHCENKSSCGTGSLSELTGELTSHIFTVSSITPLREGQIVEIGLKERSLLISIGLVYLFPLMILLVSTFLGEFLFLSEMMRALFIFCMTSVAFIGVHFYSKKLQRKTSYQPILLKVLG